ncbi:MAG: monovalent cation/H+ antiporter complex subunit F [Myxococcota bacterium]|nr:monovalent cation/H+ antiporter complex subunit F [Myxococcota bacterium]
MNGGIVETAANVAMAMLCFAIACAFYRLLRGPSLADRIISLDAIAAMLVSMALVQAVVTGIAAFIDVALTIALVGFLGTIALARAIEKRSIE